MRLSIAERLRPFSHLPGAHCLLPGCSLAVKFYPSLICIEDLKGPSPEKLIEIDLQIKGPLKNFLIVQDLEKGILFAEGEGKEGFIRYRCLLNSQKNVQINVEKVPEGGIFSKALNKTIHKGDQFEFPCPKAVVCTPVLEKERLSLGSHKKQEWELIKRRLSMDEIFPLWYSLAQQIPQISSAENEGTLKFLQECQASIASNKPETILPQFENLFMAAFEGMLVPQLQDPLYQGFNISPISSDFKGSPLTLLTKGQELIRSLFIQEKGEEIHFLPALPPQFHCGRMLGIIVPTVGKLDIEWTKKLLRRVILYSDQTKEITFQFQPSLKSFRLRKKGEQEGIRMKCGDTFSILANTIYFLDNFQK